MKNIFPFLLLSVCFITLAVFLVAATYEKESSCEQIFKESGQCPGNICQSGCLGDDSLSCPNSCVARPCVEIKREECPKDRCQVLDGCDHTQICFDKILTEPDTCGDLGYGGTLECCADLMKRCGLEFFDGTCDMVGSNSMYGVPICIPCGNGVCNQFENACNCPEDCGPKESPSL